MSRRMRARRHAVAEAAVARIIRRSAPRTEKQTLTKNVLIAKLDAARAKIIDALNALPPGKRDEVYLGEWSAEDLIAHLIGWDYSYLAAAEDLLAGVLPSFYALWDDDWASYNRYLVQQYKKGSWAELLAALRQSHQKLVEHLQTIPQQEFDKDQGVHHDGSPVTIAKLIRAEAQDEREHYRQIKEWIG